MRRLQLFAYAAFITSLAVIAYATLVPISLRPSTGHLHPERMLAYFILGGTLGVARSSRPWGALLIVCVIACGLEFLQMFIPTRDARIGDALEKSAGAVAGVGAGLIGDAGVRRLFPRASP